MKSRKPLAFAACLLVLLSFLAVFQFGYSPLVLEAHADSSPRANTNPALGWV